MSTTNQYWSTKCAPSSRSDCANKHTGKHKIIRFCVPKKRLFNVNGWRQMGNQGMDENADASITPMSTQHAPTIEINDQVHLLFGNWSVYLSFSMENYAFSIDLEVVSKISRVDKWSIYVKDKIIPLLVTWNAFKLLFHPIHPLLRKITEWDCTRKHCVSHCRSE